MISEILRKFRPPVTRHFRDEHIVTLGKRRAMVYTEMQGGGLDFIVQPSSLTSWMPPFEHDVISSEDRQQILKLLSDYLDKRGYKYKIQNEKA